MKIRIKGNSIRLRLTRPEVARLADEGLLEERTDFGARLFRWAVVTDEFASALSASFGIDGLTVTTPRDIVAKWAAGDEVGLYGEQAGSIGEPLAIAVEKDFRCLDRSRADGDEADAYPHPALKPKSP